jgi:hypothetical protein
MLRTDRRLTGRRGRLHLIEPMATTESSPADSQQNARLPPVLGLIGTFMICAAALVANMSATQLQPLAAGLWALGLFIQVIAFGMACADRWADRH